MTTESVVQFLRGKQKRLWGERGSKKWVVLLDEGSKVTELSSTGGDNVPILALKDAIHKVAAFCYNVLSALCTECITYSILCMPAATGRGEEE